MSKFLNQLLRPEVDSVLKDLPKAKYEIKRLSGLLGEPVVIELQALPYGKTQEIKDMGSETEVMILLSGCPELKAPELATKFGGATPAETVKNMLLPGEIADLSRAVERLTGYRQNTIAEVKNS
ncbi:MAG: hypothetical protein IJV74_05265 [Clostridia bacterium]|nr:hypothetical protein [Clostridia bacterium]